MCFLRKFRKLFETFDELESVSIYCELHQINLNFHQLT